MPAAGQYGDRLQWLARSINKNAQTGQDEESFDFVGYLWASVEDMTGRRQRDYGANETGADATIRVRNWPGVSALDRLTRPEWEEAYVIESIAYGDNETICTANKFDDLVI